MVSRMFRFYDQPFPEGEYRHIQMGYVVRVRDLVTAAWTWVDLYGAGPFVIPPARVLEGFYHGRPIRYLQQLAMTQMGPLQIELIHVTSDDPTHYSDMYDLDQAGPHHLSTSVADFDKAMAHYDGSGYELVTLLPMSGSRVAYFDTRPATGLFTEVIERNDRLMGGLNRTASLSANWDGTDPVRVHTPGQGYEVPPRPGAA
jgi:hypothetical protein